MSVNGRNDKKRYTMYLPSNNVGIKQCCKVVLLNGVTLNGGCSGNYHSRQNSNRSNFICPQASISATYFLNSGVAE